MPQSDLPDDAEQAPRTGLTFKFLFVALALVIAALIFLTLYFWPEATESVVAGAAAVATLIAFLVQIRLTTASQAAAVGESRQRLTRAEGALADAIRREYTEADIIVGGSLMHSRDAPLVDPELEPGHGQPAAGEVGRRGALGLPELWEATHARLNLYHEIATGQAKTSFRNAQIAMVAGFLLLILFAGIALWASTTAVAIVAGGLGAVSAALAGYVAKTFIRSQEAAATHLRSYFDQPLELSRYLAAERLVADGDLTQEQRGEILSALVQAMVAGPQPVPAPQSVVVASVPGQQGV
ncbi:TRADD-N-associated membrane domain-containing protein [Streptomyces anulatus]|uniref:TRADD-N-associated membrane domain-containing protein n=1 Tax=Streptomyces anulatus TaxID=1892 RepID=UPI002ED15043|nr:hypothetical protein OG703_33615 [Streptomyces anulatus]